jgi:hypothetical protein
VPNDASENEYKRSAQDQKRRIYGVRSHHAVAAAHSDGCRSAAILTGRKAEGSVVVPVRERRRATRIVRR